MADPASIRYLNPGGQYPGPVSRRWGSTGHETIGGGHLIASFPDAVSGAAAMFDLLRSGNYAGRPLADVIRRWSGGNNSDAYVAHVARNAGLAPDTVVTPELLSGPQGVALTRAMAGWEAGRPYPMTDAQWSEAQTRVFGGAPVTPPPTAVATAPPSSVTTPPPSTTPRPPPGGGLPVDIGSLVSGLFSGQGQGQGQGQQGQGALNPHAALAQAAMAGAAADMAPMALPAVQFAPMTWALAPRRMQTGMWGS